MTLVYYDCAGDYNLGAYFFNWSIEDCAYEGVIICRAIFMDLAHFTWKLALTG